MIGKHLGSYEITGKLGEGGMGEVYRATDTKLDREVAIKVLPAAFTEDPERLARFEREAKLLAQLHHPHIASIFGLEESEGIQALVMELVEGPTLDERMAQGDLEQGEILEIGRQIAEALEEAHEKGIIHRDLKPQNVKLTPEGRVKVLDFGLAKAMDPTAGSTSVADLARSPTLLNSPTLTAVHGTELGVILGTAAYMAPEQARGKAVDKRADIWAFGVVLFEMLVGRSLFSADTVTDTLAGVLKTEIDFSLLPDSTDPALGRLLRRCLQRNPRNRLHDIADARIVIEEISAGGLTEAQVEPSKGRAPAWLPWSIAAAGIAAALVALLVGIPEGSPPPSSQPTRTSVLMPISGKAEQRAGSFAISPDGEAIVFLVSGESGARLFLRELSDTESSPREGTDGASFPFWSADSRHVAFFAGGWLRRVPRDGGPVQAICAAKDGRGGAWSSEGTIVFAADYRAAPLYQVSDSGGEPVVATILDVDKGESSHRFPAFLPDGRHFLFGVEPALESGRVPIKVATLDEVSQGRPLLEASAVPRFALPDQIVFLRDRALMAQELDLQKLEMVGEAKLLEERLNLEVDISSTPVAHVSNRGSMLYAAVDPRPTTFAWLDRSGARSETGVREDSALRFPALSHGGNRLAVSKEGGSRGEISLWIFDLEHGGSSRITPENRSAWSAIWSPDDRELVSNMGPNAGSSQHGPAFVDTESGQIREVMEPAEWWTSPTDVSTDGRILVMDHQVVGMRFNVQFLHLDREPERLDYLATPANELGGKLSPDGRYIAYLSDVSGTTEAYVDTFPEPSRARRVSTLGEAQEVNFRADGQELFIRAVDGGRTALFASDLHSSGELEVGYPQKLFTLPVEWSGLAAAPAGDRFLLLERVGNRSPSLTLVENWRAQLGATP